MHVLLRAVAVASLALIALPASATIWNVQPTSCSDVSCTPCCTIQAAIERCNGGDTVSIAAGTYAENLDLEDMAAMGTITLESSGGPGTVLVSPAGGIALRHWGDAAPGTVTIDGIDFTTPDSKCLDIDHDGDVVLRDVTANNCGNHAVDLESNGHVTIEGCTVNGSPGDAIQVNAAASLSVSDCDMADNNKGISTDLDGDVTILDSDCSGGTSHAFQIEANGFVLIERSTADSNDGDGFSVSGTGSTRITDCTSTNNDKGLTTGVEGDVTILDTDCSGNDRANFEIEAGGVVHIERCTGNSSEEHSGFDIWGFEGDLVDGVTLVDCSASFNGPLGTRSGIIIDQVAGPVVVSGCVANGNSAHGIDLQDVTGQVLVTGSEAKNNAWSGIDLGDVKQGPVLLFDNLFQGNSGKGLEIDASAAPIDVLRIRRNEFVDNDETGLEIDNLAVGGIFRVQCNDISGNLDEGLELMSAVTVDARSVWWGDASGPSGDGPGTGDSVISNGGTVLFDPWLQASYASPTSTCEIFESGGESGSLHEWSTAVTGQP